MFCKQCDNISCSCKWTFNVKDAIMFFLFSFLLFLWSRRVSHSQKQPKAVLWQKIMPVLILWNRMWSFAKYSWLIRKIRSFKGNYWICFSCYRHYKIGVRITSCCSFPLLTQKSLFSYTDVCKVTQQQFRRYLGIMEKMIMVHIKSVTFHWKQVHANKRKFIAYQFICILNSCIL